MTLKLRKIKSLDIIGRVLKERIRLTRNSRYDGMIYSVMCTKLLVNIDHMSTIHALGEYSMVIEKITDDNKFFILSLPIKLTESLNIVEELIHRIDGQI